MALDHYVSQVHLRRFYCPELKHLMYAIRKNDLKKFTPDSKSICRIDEGNTNKFLQQPRLIEDFLKRIEGKYNYAVEKLENGSIDLDSIYVAAGFPSYLLTCSPTAIRMNSSVLKGMVELTTKVLDENGKLPRAPDILGGGTLSELLKSGDVKIDVDAGYPQAINIKNILDRISSIGNSQWDIMINEHNDCPFFTSDFPMICEATRDPRLINRIVPFSPRLAIRFMPNIDSSRQKTDLNFTQFRYRRRRISRQEALATNRLLVRAAEDLVLFRDNKDWVNSFVEKNRDYRTDAEIVNLPSNKGYLQFARHSIVKFERPYQSKNNET